MDDNKNEQKIHDPSSQNREDLIRELIAELARTREAVADLTNAIDVSAGWIEGGTR